MGTLLVIIAVLGTLPSLGGVVLAEDKLGEEEVQEQEGRVIANANADRSNLPSWFIKEVKSCPLFSAECGEDVSKPCCDLGQGCTNGICQCSSAYDSSSKCYGLCAKNPDLGPCCVTGANPNGVCHCCMTNQLCDRSRGCTCDLELCGKYCAGQSGTKTTPCCQDGKLCNCCGSSDICTDVGCKPSCKASCKGDGRGGIPCCKGEEFQICDPNTQECSLTNGCQTKEVCQSDSACDSWCKGQGVGGGCCKQAQRFDPGLCSCCYRGETCGPNPQRKQLQNVSLTWDEKEVEDTFLNLAFDLNSDRGWGWGTTAGYGWGRCNCDRGLCEAHCGQYGSKGCCTRLPVKGNLHDFCVCCGNGVNCNQEAKRCECDPAECGNKCKGTCDTATATCKSNCASNEICKDGKCQPKCDGSCIAANCKSCVNSVCVANCPSTQCRGGTCIKPCNPTDCGSTCSGQCSKDGTTCDSGCPGECVSGQCPCTDSACSAQCNGQGVPCCTTDLKECKCCPKGWNCASSGGWGWRSRGDFASGNSSSGVERAGVCTNPCSGVICPIPGDSCQSGVCKCDSKLCGDNNLCEACGSTGHCGPIECGDCAKCNPKVGCVFQCDRTTQICNNDACQCNPTTCGRTCNGRCNPQTQLCDSGCPGGTGTQCDPSSGQCLCTDSACSAQCNGQGVPCCTTDLKDCKCCPTGWNCAASGGWGWGWRSRDDFASGNSSSVERAGVCTDPCVGVTCPIHGDSCQDGVCKCDKKICGANNLCEVCGLTGHCVQIVCGPCQTCSPKQGCVTTCTGAEKCDGTKCVDKCAGVSCTKPWEKCVDGNCECDPNRCESIDKCHVCALGTCDIIKCGACASCDAIKGCFYLCDPLKQDCVNGACKDKDLCQGVVCVTGNECVPGVGSCQCNPTKCGQICNGRCNPNSKLCESGCPGQCDLSGQCPQSCDEKCKKNCISLGYVDGCCEDGDGCLCCEQGTANCATGTLVCSQSQPPACTAESCSVANCERCNAQTGKCAPIPCPPGLDCDGSQGGRCVCTDDSCLGFCFLKGEPCCNPDRTVCDCCTNGKSCKSRELGGRDSVWRGNVSHSWEKLGTCETSSCDETACTARCGTCLGPGCAVEACPTGLGCDPTSGTCKCSTDSCGSKCDGTKGESPCCTKDKTGCNCCPRGTSCDPVPGTCYTKSSVRGGHDYQQVDVTESFGVHEKYFFANGARLGRKGEPRYIGFWF